MTKKIVVPGELVTTERKNLGEHVFVRNGKIYSDVIGLVEDDSKIANVVPLEGCYKPKVNDTVIGVVSAETFSGLLVDINSFYPSYLSKEAVREPLKPSSIVYGKIFSVDELNEAKMDEVRVFYGGQIITVSPVKVPRLIGKNGSMIEVLKKGTNTNFMIGRNGFIWAKGGNIDLFVKAVKKIEREAHLSNLTNKMTDFLAKNR
ncbi:MAG: exosome complex protein Rrp4 [archaeon]